MDVPELYFCTCILSIRRWVFQLPIYNLTEQPVIRIEVLNRCENAGHVLEAPFHSRQCARNRTGLLLQKGKRRYIHVLYIE